MTDFSLRVGIDISARQVSATWGTTPDDRRPVVEVEQSGRGYQHQIHQLHQTGHDPARCQVVMEATGTYWMRLAYTLHDAGLVSVSSIRSKPIAWPRRSCGGPRPMPSTHVS